VESVQNPTLLIRCGWLAHGFNRGNRAIMIMKQTDPRNRFNLMLKFIASLLIVRILVALKLMICGAAALLTFGRIGV
jgi:hypothetical protein